MAPDPRSPTSISAIGAGPRCDGGVTLLATEIKVDPTADEVDVVFENAILGLWTGTCPGDGVFTIDSSSGGQTVTTTALTTFADGDCSSIIFLVAHGDHITIEVRGVRLADGSIVASAVDFDAN